MSTEAESSSREPATSAAKSKSKLLFWAAFLVVFATVFAARMILAQRLSLPPVVVQLPTYKLTNERGQTFGAEELRGKTYVANFVFTSCPIVCPKLSKRMLEVQDRTKDLGDALHLVTFTVDPENDTPEVLKGYAEKYSADPKRWVFLTGQLKEIEPVIMQGFKTMMKKQQAPSGMFEIVHGERFVLVDGKGFIRGFYEATSEGIDTLITDARKIAK